MKIQYFFMWGWFNYQNFKPVDQVSSPLHVYGLSFLYRPGVQSRTTVTYYPRYFILRGFPVLINLYLELLDGELFFKSFFFLKAANRHFTTSINPAALATPGCSRNKNLNLVRTVTHNTGTRRNPAACTLLYICFIERFVCCT